MGRIKLIYVFLPFVISHEIEEKARPTFTNFRKKVEEVLPETTPAEDDTSNIVSFLVKNVKKLFGSRLVLSDVDQNINEITTPLYEINTTNSIILMHKNQTITKSSLDLPTDVNAVTNFLIQDLLIKNELLNLSRDLDAISKAEATEKYIKVIKSTDDTSTVLVSQEPNITITRKSCIFCNNVDIEDCTDPQNKLIPSTVCEQDEDLCYSQHTPFGIIDRGCFNINRNVTVYVCSCNLCNYLAISEMPQIFSSKRDWIENVIEMSRTKRFRLSVFKDMTCLRCEANVTRISKDIVESTNCLEGNIGALPIQECTEDEICGVRAIRSEGYLWRGCISRPLYNYWWNLCDTDLCNYDALVSMYDNFW
ncbi:uncharacterized protein LOC119834083 [Zerene cesonia]|uniref:uncharacterized protein LOC119834083 n=1 Tax=Zerene cesonia TaxID=33412 RepID=UPI0018E5461F|nr:uncharacterized protein LOC119834083 [Zerene cesonia]